MLNPNNPIAKALFLIITWYILFYPCQILIKDALNNFKKSKKIVKVFKIMGIGIPLFIIIIMTLFYIERIIHFSTWHIGGSN